MSRIPTTDGRVIAVTSGLSPGVRHAMWPAGIDAAVLKAMEKSTGIKPPAPISKATPKSTATTAAAKPTTPPAPQAHAGAPAAKAASPAPPVLTREQRLGAAIESTIAKFNQEFGQI